MTIEDYDYNEMQDGTIVILGEEIPVKIGKCRLDQLQYYTDNPRIYSIIRSNRDDGGEPTEEEIGDCLQEMDDVKKLREDIERNGGLIDPIIVKRGNLEKSEVIEGNRRLAAYRKLASNDLITWGEIKCIFLPSNIKKLQILSLLGQYHLKGKKEWSPYEQAGLLYRSFREQGISEENLVKHLVFSKQKVRHLIDTYQLMIDNKDDRRYKWSYYEEYNKSQTIKKHREKIPGYHEAILKQIKLEKGEFGHIEYARDIRDKLAKIPVKNKKILKRIVSGQISIDEAHDLLDATGSLDETYKKINRFYEWLNSEKTKQSLKEIAMFDDPNRIKFTLDKLSKTTTKLRKLLEKQQ